MSKCPVCGQTLPQAINQSALKVRLARLTATARAQERRSLERELHTRVTKAVDAERDRITKSAERHVSAQLAQERRRADRAEHSSQIEIERIRRQGERDAERSIRMAARSAAAEGQAQIRQLEAKREKERARWESERAHMQNKFEELSHRYDRLSADGLGKEAELDLLLELNKAFQGDGDRIQHIRRGVKGADLVHDIIEDGKRVGRIVYESKNVSTWNHKFITQAKQYQTQYDTPNVIVVSRRLPQKKKGLCILKSIPIVEPHMAVCLASIIRDGIREIGLARTTGAGRDQKAQHLYEYILSNGFVTRFREIAESVDSLRERQRKERDWHEDVWGEQSVLYDKIDGRRREVYSQIQAILKKSTKGELPRLAVSR